MGGVGADEAVAFSGVAAAVFSSTGTGAGAGAAEGAAAPASFTGVFSLAKGEGLLWVCDATVSSLEAIPKTAAIWPLGKAARGALTRGAPLDLVVGNTMRRLASVSGEARSNSPCGVGHNRVSKRRRSRERE